MRSLIMSRPHWDAGNLQSFTRPLSPPMEKGGWSPDLISEVILFLILRSSYFWITTAVVLAGTELSPASQGAQSVRNFQTAHRSSPLPPADVVYKSLDPLCLKRALDPPTPCTFCAVDVSQDWTWPAWEPDPQTLVHALVAPGWCGLGVSGCLNHRASKSVTLLWPKVY